VSGGTAPVFQYRLDLAYPHLKLGIEYDGDHHRDKITFRRDITRLNGVWAAGWTILRFTADDIRRPQRIIAMLSNFFRPGCRFPAVSAVGKL
jgi:very-short-patch-repair endonuclease